MSQNKQTLSVAIVTKNEEEMLPKCLESVSWADHILVVDSFSTDRTQEIASKAGAEVISREWGGYADQKNFAMDRCVGDWVFILDADERVSPELADEVSQILASSSPIAAFRVPFRMYCLGREIRHGGWGRDYYVHRLVRRGQARYGQKDVHERLVVSGSEASLKGHVEHHPYRTVSQMIIKQDLYSSLEARDLLLSHHRPVAKRDFLLRPMRYWLHRYVIGLGFLDGPEGLILATMHAFCRLLVMGKLWRLQTQDPSVAVPGEIE